LQFIKSTGCIPKCISYKYKAETVTATPSDNKNDITSEMKLIVYVGRPSLTVHEEYDIYSEDDLFADMGGFLGVLLGFSFLGAFSDILQIFVKISSKKSRG
jgi:hypothetical protein